MADDTPNSRVPLKERLKDAAFDVEHALGMYAKGFCTLPAQGIYDTKALAPLMDVIKSCHIYMVGFVPRIQNKDFRLENGVLSLVMTVLGTDYTVTYDNVPNDWVLKEDDEFTYLESPSGEKFWPDDNHVQSRLSNETGAIAFHVKYIGQAYGTDGSRNALDRLLKHETLQKISLKGVPDGYNLTLLLLSVEPSTQLFTTFNPFARNKDDEGTRIKAGLDKLFNTSEAERTTLYEASMIRYFYPEYNTEFKNSFPSTKLKDLQDCYEKDFSAVIAEICIDELPFRLRSEVVAPSHMHIAKHDLHKTEDRRIFFGL